MKTRAWMLFSCCLGLLAPLPFASAEEPQGFVKITVGVEGDGLEKIPVVGPLLQHFIGCQEKPCAEQVQLQLPAPPTQCPACPPNERGVPLLSKLPYITRLFKNVGPVSHDEVCDTESVQCPASRTTRHAGPDGLERIGVDFDVEVPQQCAQCQANRCALANATRATAACAAPTANCPPVTVWTAPAAGYPLQACEVLPAPIVIGQQPQTVASRDELLEALLEARVEAAVAQTALQVREESDAKQLELIKALVESQVENAKLTAKLELAAEKAEMLTELLEARAELALLESQGAKTKDVAQRKRQQRKETEARRPVESLR